MSDFDGRSSAWQTPSFSNGWVNYGSASYQDAGYSLQGRRVFLRGVVKNGTLNSIVFTLPTAFCPANREIFVGIDGTNTAVRIDVTASGGVFSTGATSNAYLSLSGISFDVG